MNKGLTVLMVLFFCWQAQGNCQVTLQNGAVDFSLPIYQYRNATNELSLDVGLKYTDGNGLRVSERASEEGTGWALEAGGCVTRIQHGLPDDQRQNTVYTYPPTNNAQTVQYNANYYPSGYMYAKSDNNYAPTDVIDDGAAYIATFSTGNIQWQQAPQYLADREQDVYVVDLNGRSVSFVIGQDQSIRLLGDQNVQVTMKNQNMYSSRNIRTTIYEFDITDENGIEYIFNQMELSKVYAYDRTSGQWEFAVPPTSFPNGPVTWTMVNGQPTSSFTCLYGRQTADWVVTKWFLSQIINPRSNQSIYFNYSLQNIYTNGDFTAQTVNMNGNISTQVTSIETTLQAPRISSIQFPDSKTLYFNYDPTPRLDLPYKNALLNVSLQLNGRKLDGFQFQYQYFNEKSYLPYNYTGSLTASQVNQLRLCLQSVSKVAADGTLLPMANFTYFLTQGTTHDLDRVPPQITPNVDPYGYYGSATNLYLPDDNLTLFTGSFWYYSIQQSLGPPKPLNAANGILQSIVWPSGGSLTYAYEQNQAYYNGANTTAGGVRVKTATVYDGVNHANDQITSYNYYKQDGTSSGWGYEPPVSTMTLQSVVAGAAGSNNFAGISGPQLGIAYENSSNLSIIKTIAFQSAFTSSVVDGELQVGASMSSIEISFVAAIVMDVVQMVVNYYSSGPSTQTYTVTANTPYNFVNPLPLRYSYVTVVHQTSAGQNNGSVAYQFTSNADNAVYVPTLQMPYPNCQREGGWLYGLPSIVTYYNGGGQIVKQIRNTYAYTSTPLTSANYLSEKWMPIKTIYDDYEFEYPNSNTDYISAQSYSPVTGHTLLTRTDEDDYNTAGTSFITTTTNYAYNAKLQPSIVDVYRSDGATVETRNYYTSDYTATPFSTMAGEYHMLSPVVTTEKWLKTTGASNFQLLDATNHGFTQISNGDYKESNEYSFKSQAPIADNQMPAFDGTTFLRDPSMQFLTNTISYDAQGHAVSTNERGRLSGMGYDAHDNCNAVITNADKSHAFYTSFEDANYDGWAVTPSDISGLDWVTGAYSYYMDGNAAAGINSLTHTLDAAATYKLSFWSKGGTPYVYSTASGGAKTFYTPVTTYANAATGWTYLEYLVPQVANVTVTNSYTGLTGPYTSLYLDELRLYPQGAFMSTRTYDPAFGVTSECDENNRIRYFQYDGFNRLKYLLDADRNVVKTYEYNFMTP